MVGTNATSPGCASRQRRSSETVRSTRTMAAWCHSDCVVRSADPRRTRLQLRAVALREHALGWLWFRAREVCVPQPDRTRVLVPDLVVERAQVQALVHRQQALGGATGQREARVAAQLLQLDP